MTRNILSGSAFVRTASGLAALAAIIGVVTVAVTMFRGGYVDSVPVTVLSQRAGLVMDPESKVKLHGADVGTVTSIEALPDGQAALHLAMNPSALQLIPSNVLVDIASTTVFGAKYVQLTDPAEPSPHTLRPGQVIDSRHVTVEINTIFQQLTSVLSTIDPVKLNQTLGALASAFNGRGHEIGKVMTDLNSFLAKLDPGLPALDHDLAVAPDVVGAYADATPDLIRIADNAASISRTIVDEQHNLDALLVSVIGLADIGNDVVGGNRKGLTDVLHLLVPTTDLTNEYHDALYCGLAGIVPAANTPPSPEPGVMASVSLLFGQERYRFPGDLPKVAATGGPQCHDLPRLGYGQHPPFVVADVGTSPWDYGNQNLLLNSDGLKQLLFGPIDGPPRNTAEIGQPG